MRLKLFSDPFGKKINKDACTRTKKIFVEFESLPIFPVCVACPLDDADKFSLSWDTTIFFYKLFNSPTTRAILIKHGEKKQHCKT
jgi:hypothetical protein